MHNMMRLSPSFFLALGLEGDMIPILQYADDTFVFIRAKRRAALKVKNLLDAYAIEVGLHINSGKSTLVFSASTSPSLIRELKPVLGIQSVAQSFLYLGETVGLNRMGTSARLRDRIQNQISLWQGTPSL